MNHNQSKQYNKNIKWFILFFSICFISFIGYLYYSQSHQIATTTTTTTTAILTPIQQSGGSSYINLQKTIESFNNILH